MVPVHPFNGSDGGFPWETGQRRLHSPPIFLHHTRPPGSSNLGGEGQGCPMLHRKHTGGHRAARCHGGIRLCTGGEAEKSLG